MSSGNDTGDVDEDTGTPGGPQAGKRLGEARKSQQITVTEVAKELHLDEYKIRALEENQFDVLGAPVFAKGHLKKYAQLVGVNSDDVLAEYYELNRNAAMPPVVGEARISMRQARKGRWPGAIVVIVAVAAASWYFLVRPASDVPAPSRTDSDMRASQGPAARPTTQAAPASRLDEPVDDEPVDDEPDENEPVVDEQIDDDPRRDEPVASDPGVRQAADASAPEPRTPVPGPEAGRAQQAGSASPPPSVAEGEVRLVLRFSGDCWAEIRDAGGRRLYVGLGRDGRVVDVAGAAPLAVTIGDTEMVSIRVNGEEYRIADTDRRGKAAVLTIPAP